MQCLKSAVAWPRRASVGGRTYRRWMAPVPALAVALAASGCLAGSVAPEGEPVPDPAGTASELSSATVPSERRQITFTWTLQESGSRVRGRGVVRLQPPDHLRLDLFGPRNESYLSAALVGDEARLPAGARDDVPIPSPALLWAGIGVIRPPRGATLQRASTTSDATILRYADPGGDVYEYMVTPAPVARLQRLQRVGSRGPLETVSLDWSEAGEVSRATYRDWSEFRDLILDIERSEAAPEFPETIWSP